MARQRATACLKAARPPCDQLHCIAVPFPPHGRDEQGADSQWLSWLKIALVSPKPPHSEGHSNTSESKQHQVHVAYSPLLLMALMVMTHAPPAAASPDAAAGASPPGVHCRPCMTASERSTWTHAWASSNSSSSSSRILGQYSVLVWF